jgi:hypothetical protein
MRKALIARLTVASAALWAGAGTVQAQETPPPLAAEDVSPVNAEAPPGPQPGDPAPMPPPVAPEQKSKKKADVAEAAGGAVGGMLAKGAGTAVAGPVGGVAAGLVGNRVGKGAVGLVKRVIGVGGKKDEAKAAPDAAMDVAANVPEPVGISEFTPSPRPPPVEDAPPVYDAPPGPAEADLPPP